MTNLHHVYLWNKANTYIIWPVVLFVLQSKTIQVCDYIQYVIKQLPQGDKVRPSFID